MIRQSRIFLFYFSILPVVLILSTSSFAISLGDSQDSGNNRTIVEGGVFDADTRLPIPHATVQVVGTGRSTLVNDDGLFRILLSEDELNLKVSHIAYYSYITEISSSDSLVKLEVFLHTAIIDIGSIKVYSRSLDPGQRIINEAIKRKQDILTKLHDYSFDAYVKLSISDISEPDSSEIMLLTETQMTAYWAYPNRYKEIIKARKQSSNIDPENNLVTVGEILNFNRDRIDLGSYSIVSPTATDALDHYNYYLLDTVTIDSKRAFLLEIEPKNKALPLFVGKIHIADSTFDVLDVEVGLSEGVDFSFVNNILYRQRFARFVDEYWMPVEINFTGEFDLAMPLPGIPDKLGFSHTASLYSYSFESKKSDSIFDEFSLVVDKKADDYDSTEWFKYRTIPLTQVEVDGYARIDSLEKRPLSFRKLLLTTAGVGVYFLSGGARDFFHYNRVEGYYLGLGLKSSLGSRLNARLSGGYGFETKRAQQQYGLTWRLHNHRRIDFSFDYMDRIIKRPSISTPRNYDPSFGALAFGEDPSDYYRAEGIEAGFSGKLFNLSSLKLTYRDQLHYSIPFGTDHTILGSDTNIRDNQIISDGKFRSVSAEFNYDSRPMVKLKDKTGRLHEVEYTKISFGIEYTTPELFKTDFDFSRYYARLFHRRRSLGMGVTSFDLYAGSSEGTLPPQRYFAFDYGNGYLTNSLSFNTLNNSIFRGNRAFSVYFKHDFKRLLFAKSGLPLIKDIPLWFSIHGGAFWNELNDDLSNNGQPQLTAWHRPYEELGFGLSNLTPFLTPFNFAVRFTWQVSDYDTERFNFSVDIDL